MLHQKLKRNVKRFIVSDILTLIYFENYYRKKTNYFRC